MHFVPPERTYLKLHNPHKLMVQEIQIDIVNADETIATDLNQMSLRATCNREAHLSLRGCALDLLVALLGLLLFVALGVLGRADLAALGVDARTTLSR